MLSLPWLAAWAPSAPLEALDTLLGWQCHRLEDRTWLIAGEPMAVCSRCAGIYLGVAAGAAMAWPRLSVRRTIIASAAALALLVIEGGLEAWGVIPTMHALRSVTGAALAWPIAAAAVNVLTRRGSAG